MKMKTVIICVDAYAFDFKIVVTKQSVLNFSFYEFTCVHVCVGLYFQKATTKP